jgi:hypothetical protein
MTEVLDRIEEELVAAARRRVAPPAPARWRGRASGRTLALAGAGVLLAGGGAVAAVTTSRDAGGVPSGVDRVLDEDTVIAALADGMRVALTVGDGTDQWTVVAYENEGGFGVRGSESLCVGGFSTDAPPEALWFSTPCQGPWPLSEGAGFQPVPVAVTGSSLPGYVTSGLVPADVRRAELVIADGVRSPVQLSPPFTVDLAGNDLEPVPRAPRDVPPAGGSVSARLAAAATAEPPEAAILTYADGRTERVGLAGG